jgi:hypothetical protein
MNVNQTRQKPASMHHGLGARDGLKRNAIPVRPKIEHLVAREGDAAKVYWRRRGRGVNDHPRDATAMRSTREMDSSEPRKPLPLARKRIGRH